MSDWRPPRQDSDDEVSLVRREEELAPEKVEREAGRVRIRKIVEEQPFDDVVTRGIEHADIERVPPMDPDSGEIESLPDGSVSIPVFEEQLVVEKRLVVRERVIVRKRVVHEPQPIATDLRREVVEVEADPEAEARLHTDAAEGTGPERTE